MCEKDRKITSLKERYMERTGGERERYRGGQGGHRHSGFKDRTINLCGERNVCVKDRNISFLQRKDIEGTESK
jgi:hypothetical protein